MAIGSTHPVGTLFENRRAAHAYEIVKQYYANHTDERKRREYASYVKKMPAMIQVNGLGQALAFYKSKGGVHTDIYTQLGNWVQQAYSPIFHRQQSQGRNDLVEAVINMEISEYRLVTREIMAYLNWLKRFADGLRE